MKKLFPALCIFFLLTACGQPDNPLPQEDTQYADQVTLFESKDSQNKWLLHADRVNFEDIMHAELINPHLTLRENGVATTEVSGKKGILNYSKKLVSIEGDAKVHSLKEHTLLTTERFFYNLDTNRIWSDKKTFVTRGNTKITAKGGIETDSKLHKIEFKKQHTQLPEDIREFQGVSK